MNSTVATIMDIYEALRQAGLEPTWEQTGLIVNVVGGNPGTYCKENGYSGQSGWGLVSVPKEIYDAVKAGATDPRPDLEGASYGEVESNGWPVAYLRNGEKFIAVNAEGVWAGDGKGGFVAIPSILDEVVDDHEPEDVKEVVETIKANLWRLR